ncbi:hypothetical protein, unlikely [Trypanosoma brucei gambiense DAL972]|uniref:Uncharacterized protein n=1 Tax=Trypanosoma brucei gambiense (strain MHOM/CI/86/DAL972) TaxID=679716 RepID=C9ZMF0_TRYB9|nr:hypothetical protein, unlikely [Trypanosoma brucei gambiense DAL972]CBH10823.1 hypothetical protein, unlikely [Trypanosoma brucei gambiense DAL972]|eukprot:XP_011773111.1 hypothetical protein, unlikely [Trypanosoma brucei gambiense DAL972]
MGFQSAKWVMQFRGATTSLDFDLSKNGGNAQFCLLLLLWSFSRFRCPSIYRLVLCCFFLPGVWWQAALHQKMAALESVGCREWGNENWMAFMHGNIYLSVSSGRTTVRETRYKRSGRVAMVRRKDL